jgi:manganese transport protein
VIRKEKRGYKICDFRQYCFFDAGFFINAAILILAAATFHTTGNKHVADIHDAYKMLTPILGASMASIAFAIALLASGQNSTLTGTLAGQIVMEGF